MWAFAWGRMKSSSLVARPIAPLPFVVCASPEYLRQRGQPMSLEDLAQHNCLRLSRIGSKEPMPWFLTDINAAQDAGIRGNLTLNDFSALQTAAVQGLGIACVPLPLAMPEIRKGALVPVLTQHISTELVVYLYYPNRKNLPTRTRTFLDYVLAALEREKDLHTPPKQLLAAYERGKSTNQA